MGGNILNFFFYLTENAKFMFKYKVKHNLFINFVNKILSSNFKLPNMLITVTFVIK